MTSHAQLSPSKAHRWTVCPGSIREEAKYPDVSGAAAIDGTHSHTLLEKSLLDNKDPLEYVGQTLTDHEGDFVYDDGYKCGTKHDGNVEREEDNELGWVIRNHIERWSLHF